MTSISIRSSPFQLCVCAEEYIFLGSRLGNSLLVRFTETEQDTVITIDDSDILGKEKERETKRVEEELEVYGSGLKTSVQLTSYNFEVCDSVLNIAPIGYLAVGERYLDEEEAIDKNKEPNAKPELEIVTSSGHGKNGALCVLQQSINPQIITSFSLSGCRDVWTVYDESVPRELNHAFMVLSQESTTMVLQTGDEINEVENTGFCGNQTTIHVGNIGNNHYIAQILSHSIRLLQGPRMLQNIQIDSDSAIVQVSICDPYICAQTAKGSVISLALRDIRGTQRLAINKNTISNVIVIYICRISVHFFNIFLHFSQSPAVIGLSAYRDVSGMFTTKYEDFSDPNSVSSVANRFGYMKPEPTSAMKFEDEEDLLYGESGSSFKMKNVISFVVYSMEIDKLIALGCFTAR